MGAAPKTQDPRAPFLSRRLALSLAAPGSRVAPSPNYEMGTLGGGLGWGPSGGPLPPSQGCIELQCSFHPSFLSLPYGGFLMCCGFVVTRPPTPPPLPSAI